MRRALALLEHRAPHLDQDVQRWLNLKQHGVLDRRSKDITNGRRAMPTVYVRRFDLKDSLTDNEVAAFWRYAVEEFLPACQKASGVRSAKIYSGAGALRDAGVYENL